MSQVHKLPAARPFALDADDGDRIWFGGGTMNFKATALATDGELFLMEADMPAGFSPPLHVHHDEHEAFYILDGELEIVCGSERYVARAGSFAFLPRGIAHTFRVLSDGARALTIAVPGGIEHFFREAGSQAEGAGSPPASEFDVALVQSVASRFNIEFVGPPLGPA